MKIRIRDTQAQADKLQRQVLSAPRGAELLAAERAAKEVVPITPCIEF